MKSIKTEQFFLSGPTVVRSTRGRKA
jgi:hypothetical protein